MQSLSERLPRARPMLHFMCLMVSYSSVLSQPNILLVLSMLYVLIGLKDDILNRWLKLYMLTDTLCTDITVSIETVMRSCL